MVAFVCLATAVATLVGNGDLAIAVAPAVMWAMWFLPLRVSMVGLLAAAWVFDAPGEVFAANRAESLWPMAGKLLWSKLNLVFPYRGLVFSGFDLLLVLLFIVLVYRDTKRLPIDRAGWVDTPPPIGTFAWLSVVAVLWLSFYGLEQNGSFRFILWQSIKWLYLPIIYALMRQGLRGVQDAKMVGGVVLVVGLFKAVEAIVLRLNFPSYQLMPHATTHADSVLFSTCVAILAAVLVEIPTRRSLRLFLLLSPVYFWAMAANNRRLAWTEVGLVAVMFWIITPWGPLKLKLARLGVLALLPVLLYAAVGWDSESRIFQPVQILRSIVGSKLNASSEWRDMENFNLIYMFRDSPLLGTGFGHPAVERIHLPDVTAAYELEPYIPHNSVLGLWAFGGLLGFSLLWMVFPVGMFFAIRAYHWARTPLERVTALGAAAAQICYLIQGYGDLGFGTYGSLLTVAAGYALVGKICITRGAWSRAQPSRRKSKKGAVSRRANGRLPARHLVPVAPPS